MTTTTVDHQAPASAWVRQVSIAGSHIPLGAPMVVVLERNGRAVDLGSVGAFLEGYRGAMAGIKELKALQSEAAAHGDADPSAEIKRLKSTADAWKAESERLGLALREAEEKAALALASAEGKAIQAAGWVDPAELADAKREAAAWKKAHDEAVEAHRKTSDREFDLEGRLSAAADREAALEAKLAEAREEIGRLNVLVDFDAKTNTSSEGPWVPAIAELKARLDRFEKVFPWIDKVSPKD